MNFNPTDDVAPMGQREEVQCAKESHDVKTSHMRIGINQRQPCAHVCSTEGITNANNLDIGLGQRNNA